MLSSGRASATLPASDIGRAKKFYGEVLGLEVAEETPDGIEFKCGKGTAVFVYPSGSAGTNQATAVGFEVADIEKEKKELEGKGVTFENYDMPGLTTKDGIATLPGGKGAWFKDSENNILALTQRT